MKTYTYNLTSDRLAPVYPSVLDHWFITDPVYGSEYVYSSAGEAIASNWTYPTSTFGGDIYPSTFTTFVCGGEIFPWGYQVLDQTQIIVLPNFKSDITITFCASGLDISQHDLLKIVYDPANGTDNIRIVNRPILPSSVDFSGDVFLTNREFDSPIYTNVSFTYQPSSVPITYYPCITALYGDMTRLYYFFEVTIYPGSIYDADNIHLISTVQLPLISGGTLNTLEIESRDQLVVNVLIDLPEPESTVAALLPAPMIFASLASVIWAWTLPDPDRWFAYTSSDGGVTFVYDDFVYGSARQYDPDGTSQYMLIVGVDAAGNEITARSNAVRPDDAFLPP